MLDTDKLNVDAMDRCLAMPHEGPLQELIPGGRLHTDHIYYASSIRGGFGENFQYDTFKDEWWSVLEQLSGHGLVKLVCEQQHITEREAAMIVCRVCKFNPEDYGLPPARIGEASRDKPPAPLAAMPAGLKPESGQAQKARNGSQAPAPSQSVPGHGTGELEPVSLAEFLDIALPPMRMLLDPILPCPGLAMIHAVRGVGKTYAALSLAWAAASGASVFERWLAPEPCHVLYIDGEMSQNMMQERLRAICGASSDQEARARFALITPDLYDDPLPNLAMPPGQRMIAKAVASADLIVLDNIATLLMTGNYNEAESWLPIQAWLRSLRHAGKSVILIHHSGKNGGQRGTSAKEDILDTVVDLRRPGDYEMDDGCRFQVHITKGRGIYGEAAAPFEAWLRDGVWLVKSLEDDRVGQVREMLDEGLNQSQIAEALGVNRSTISRLCEKHKLKAAKAGTSAGMSPQFAL